MPLRVSGMTGVLRWGYRHAADVTSWSYADGFIRATLGNVNPVAVTQRPLVLVVSNAAAGRPDFRRELENVAVNGVTLTATFVPRRG